MVIQLLMNLKYINTQISQNVFIYIDCFLLDKTSSMKHNQISLRNEVVIIILSCHLF